MGVSESTPPGSNMAFPRMMVLLLLVCTCLGGVMWTFGCSEMQPQWDSSLKKLFENPRSGEKLPRTVSPKNLASNDLPIVPQITNSSKALTRLFEEFPSNRGGWVNVNKLSMQNVEDLRSIARQLLNRATACAYSKVIRGEDRAGGFDAIPKDDTLEYCMWDKDVVSSMALNNFTFESSHWKWVVSTFTHLHEQEARIASNPKCSGSLGFLDIGVNVGDWVSPIRLLLPSVPMYGVEGSPATAAIAIANLRTSVEYHSKKNYPVASTLILPFSLAAEAGLGAIRENGGVCFSQAEFIGFLGKDNIGGRLVTNKMNCPVSDAAGATTLNAAAKQAALAVPQCPASEWPRIYIAKIDVEGHEFKTMSSVVEWFSRQPPCYVMMEFWRRPAYTALIELFLDLGYDSLWAPDKTRLNNYPGMSDPWWNLQRDGPTAQRKLSTFRPGKYGEIIFGFSDVDRCLKRLSGRL